MKYLSLQMTRTSSSYSCIVCTCSSHQFYMETKQHTIAIDGGLQTLRADVYKSMFFVHAMAGCCAMFAMFGVGKTKPFKVLHASENLSAGSADVWY